MNLLIFYQHQVPEKAIFDNDFVVPIGKAKVVREGKDITIVTYSLQVQYALDAAEKLKKEGIDAEVIDLRTIRPLDEETIIKSVKKTNRLIALEEGWPFAGVASEICTLVANEAFDYLDVEPMRVTGKDVPMPYAKNLEDLALPSVAQIVETAKDACYR